MTDIAAQYGNLVAQIGAAAEKAGRVARDIRLLAASKSQSIENVRAAIAAGVTLIGENYVQEAQAKQPAISRTVEWHMIGHLQRNKLKTAVELFDVIETLDSSALARALNDQGARRNKPVRTLIEVNLAEEKSKSGIPPDRLAYLLEEIGDLTHIQVEGLMTVPPMQEHAENARPYFHALRQLRERFRDVGAANICLKELSMGMSDDFAVAVEEGATIVRIGTALFGARLR